MFKDMREFLDYLEGTGNLLRVHEELSPKFEIPAAMKYLASEKDVALRFEKVKGYDVPIAACLLGRGKRLAMALGIDGGMEEIQKEYLSRRKNPIKLVIVQKGPAKEVIIDKDVDILKTMPVLTHHEKDVNPYFTSAITIAKDPETGMRGMGIHRIEIKDKDTIGIFLGSPPLSNFLKKADEKNKPLEIAIAVGVDPITFFASVIWAPSEIDKFDIAGGLAKAPIELVKCESIDVEVPASSEYVLEGYLIPKRREKEGPFAESTGYYLTYDNPVGKIKVITHRKNPIYHALMPFTSGEACLGLSREFDNLEVIRKVFPHVLGVHQRSTGLVAFVKIDKKSDEDVPKIIDYFMNSNPKVIIVVDKDVNIYDPYEVEWAMTTRFQPDVDVIIKKDFPGLSIDPSGRGGEITPELGAYVTRTSKIGIDATVPLAEKERYEKIDVPKNVKERVIGLLKC